jgi:membrane-associated phospholipid phosphatase
MVYKVLKNNLFFIIPYIIILIVVGWVLFSFSKSDIHLWINSHNGDFLDGFFSRITFLGNGIFVVMLGIVLLLHSLRSSVFVLTTYLSTGLLVQILKRFVFTQCVRPVRFFPNTVHLHLVDGVRLLGDHSFPSGHSASAFALFLCLSIICKNKPVQFVFFLLACMVSFSRVYLSQHFLVDIYAGSIIGIIGTLCFYPLFYRKNLKWHQWSLIKSMHHE